MIDRERLGDEMVDSTLRALRWLMGGASGGLLTHWVVNDTSDLGIAIGGTLLLLVSLTIDLVGKAAAGTYGTNVLD